MSEIFTSYTPRFAPDDATMVESLCEFRTQSSSQVENTTDFVNTVDYSCQYQSYRVNVSDYPALFVEYVNSNLTGVTEDLQNAGLSVIESGEAKEVAVITDSPTISAMPSGSPTPKPTIRPSIRPTIQKPPSLGPTPDFNAPVTRAPFPSPSNTKISVPAIASIVVLSAVAVLVGLVFYLQRRRKQRMMEQLQSKRNEPEIFHLDASPSNFTSPPPPPPGGYRPYGKSSDYDDVDQGGNNQNDVLSPSGSLMSNKSLLSDGGSNLDAESSGEEVDDGTKHLQDEFDQYKDQNLEQLRLDVEENLTGFEGVMSAAMTKALIGDDDTKSDPSELLWGCQGNPSGSEIEASALCEVCDWLKRNENEPEERKREFMQEILNKMVASVRHGALQADDAARTIHESAALLELELAHELPMTTVIVSGMRMSVEAKTIVSVLEEYGEIDTAAVASGERGFAILRFRHPKSVERAMRRYRNDEIVIEDVAIQIRVLTPSGEILSRA